MVQPTPMRPHSITVPRVGLLHSLSGSMLRGCVLQRFAPVGRAALPLGLLLSITGTTAAAASPPAAPASTAAPATTLLPPPQPAAQAEQVTAAGSDSMHTTDWDSVNVYKFLALTVIFSTTENAMFYPFFVIKTREQAEQLRNAGSGSAGASKPAPWFNTTEQVRTILREQGWRNGVYRGFWLSSLAAFPAYGVYMGPQHSTPL